MNTAHSVASAPLLLLSNPGRVGFQPSLGSKISFAGRFRALNRLIYCRGPSDRPGEEQADKLDPGTDELKEPSFARPHTRRNRWHVPSSTNSAARKAAERLMGPKPQPKDSSQEQEYEKLIESLRKSGRIGHQGHTPAGRQRTVQDLPQLHVSSKLAHAAEIGKHQASHGYQLTGGIKPKNKLGMEHLNMLKRMRGEDSNSNIWQ